ncbi:cobyric acid synthase [Rhodoplanes serenus]|uniref:Cobyric acid synthase n=2 Tax=Rhodoplanes serenus TaxID=200615 RepID=A0A9X4XMF7_9BRAD|nr:cobyric acid synthase [Rhodoplanes serenus]
MFQGTGSDVGKSLIVAGLARLLTGRGLVVRPFKPQNMSNNAAVTADGGEIGRAQALQARAARVPPSVHMNPVLLKPQSEVGAQIVVQGRVVGNARAKDYQSRKAMLMPAVLDSFSRMRGEADIVLVEGAGSASEVNLRANDIANMGFARAADVPVVLIGDIDRGGVIASLIGTAAAIDPADARLIRGFIVNKMRGDPTLFAAGMDFVAARTGWVPLGLVPWFRDAHRLPAEDIFGLDAGSAAVDVAADDDGARRRIRVAVPVLPHIANFDDLDPLRLDPAVDLVLLKNGAPLPVDTDLVVLPGSKVTIADLAALRACGWAADIVAHARRGGRVLGLCGGYQMLGRSVADSDGIEGPPATVEGLGLLDVETVLGGDKALVAVTGMSVADGVPLAGYEMHMGTTDGPDTARPLVRLDDVGNGPKSRPDGAVSADGRIAGSYVHGLFADDRQRAAWLARLGAPPAAAADRMLAYEATVEGTLDALAAHLAAHLDIERLLEIAR